jgi:hypothetical protein
VPIGFFDSVTGSAVNGTVDGWTFDLDSPSTAIGVHAYFYPPSGSPTVVTGTTTVTRSDVNSAYGITGTHGFSIPVPKALYNGTTYTVRIYGIAHHDPTGNSNAEIGASPRTFNYTNQVPVGNNDGNVNADGNVHGWAYDPNHPGDGGQVIHVQYYNTTTWALVTTVVTSTNQLRSDVNTAYGITGNHGFTTRYCNGAQLYASAYAFDLNSGSPTSIGGQYIAACTP